MHNGSYNGGDISSYGSYYTFSTITSGTTDTMTSGESNSDICPKNWYIPSEVEGGRIIELYSGGKIVNGTSWPIVYAGAFYGRGSIEYVVNGAYFLWGRTIYNNERAYAISHSSGGVGSLNFQKYECPRPLGGNVRCLTK